MLRYWALLATAAAQRYEVLEGVELVWAAPPAAPKGLVALFHATGRRAHHWWPASPKCPSCKALPAEASLARACLKHGLAAASLTAQTNVEFRRRPARRPRPRGALDEAGLEGALVR